MKKLILTLCTITLLFIACDRSYINNNVCKISLINKYYPGENFELLIDSSVMDIKKEYWIYKYDENKTIDSALIIEYKIPQKYVEHINTIEFTNNNNTLFSDDDFLFNGGFHFIFKVTENKKIERDERYHEYGYIIYSDEWDKIEL